MESSKKHLWLHFWDYHLKNVFALAFHQKVQVTLRSILHLNSEMHLVVAPLLSPQICKPNRVWILKILVCSIQLEEKKLKHFKQVSGDFIFPGQGGDFIAEGRAVSLDTLLALLQASPQTQSPDFSSFCSQSCQEALSDTRCAPIDWMNNLKLQTHSLLPRSSSSFLPSQEMWPLNCSFFVTNKFSFLPSGLINLLFLPSETADS